MNSLNANELCPMVVDFPKPGVSFRDISPLLKNSQALHQIIQKLVSKFLTVPIHIVAGLESRGFLIGILLAQELKLPFIMIRKSGKLPGPVVRTEYTLEYNFGSMLEIQKNAILPGQKVLLVDDILATGESLLAAYTLISQVSGMVTGMCCIGHLDYLQGLGKIKQMTGLVCETGFCIFFKSPNSSC